jgi:hypothetical protein
MRPFRLALELLGLVLYAGAHIPLALVYALGSSFREVQPAVYWTALALGYLVVVAVLLVRPWPLGAVQARLSFDAWLLSAVPALVLTAVMVSGRWPFEFERWNAHGFGADGGEANAILFPWLQALIWGAAAGYLAMRGNTGTAAGQ